MDDVTRFGFHRDPKDLDTWELRETIWGNCWNEDGLHIRHEDLVSKWDSAAPDERHPDYEDLSQREALVLGFVKLCEKRRWAWHGLHRLACVLAHRGQEPPARLKDWVFAAYTGTISPPEPRGNPGKDDRNLRIAAAFRWLTSNGWSKRKAYAEIAGALGKSSETVRTVCRRVADTFR